MPEGPFVTIAAFCQKVRNRPVERMRDLIGQSAVAELSRRRSIETVGVVAVNCGNRVGTFKLTLAFTDGDGVARGSTSLDLEFNHVGQEICHLGPMTFENAQPGVFWMTVKIDGQDVAQSPLLVVESLATVPTMAGKPKPH